MGIDFIDNAWKKIETETKRAYDDVENAVSDTWNKIANSPDIEIPTGPPEAPQAPEIEIAALPEDESEAEAQALREEEEKEAARLKGLSSTQVTKMPSLLNSLMDSAKKSKLG